MQWLEYYDWWALYIGERGKARLYKPDYQPKWKALLIDPRDEYLYLDPELTQDEAMQVMQTIVGAQQ